MFIKGAYGWLNAKELGLNWNGLERDVGASSMLNEERSFSSLEEVTKLLIAAEGKTFRELDETVVAIRQETRARLAISKN